jgi:hypothetical protein
MSGIQLPNDWDEPPGSALLEATRNTWTEFADRLERNSRGYLLVDMTASRLDTIQLQCKTANYVADHLGLEPLFLDEPSPEKRRICMAHYPGEFVSVGRSMYSTKTKVSGVVDFVRSYLEIDDVQSFIDLVVRGVPVGGLAYSTSLQNSGDGTFETVDRYLLQRLLSALMLVHHSEQLFAERDIGAVIGRHVFYERNGVVCRVGIREGAPLYNYKRGIGLIRKYDSLTEVKEDFSRPEQPLFECVYEDNCDVAVSAGKRIMTERVGVSPTGSPRENHSPSGESSLLSDLSLSQDDPIVLVFPHIFIENIRFDNDLFQDYLTWFRETIQFAAEMDSTNWLVKPHPDRDQFDQNQSVFEEVEKIAGDDESSVHLIPEETDHADLIPLADAILTLDGTVGIEYSCYGVPTILASESSYSGFGFTYEPESRSEYFRQLSDVGSLQPLSTEQRERALAMAFIQFELLRENAPEYPSDGTDWENALAFVERTELREDPYYRSLGTYLAKDPRHLTPSEDTNC